MSNTLLTNKTSNETQPEASTVKNIIFIIMKISGFKLGTHRIANYQLPKDLQEPMRQHQKDSQHFKDVLLGALINVPVTEYRNGQAKIKSAEVIRILILPVRTHDSRWITRSQFTKPDYPMIKWVFGTVKFDKEIKFLTHDFQQANQQ